MRRTLRMAALLAALMTSPVAAQPACDYSDTAKKYLVEVRGERLRTYVTMVRKNRVEVWTNRTTGTWTILFSMPQTVCLLGTGTNAELLVPVLADEYCIPTAAFRKILAARGEKRRSGSMRPDGAVIELWTTQNTGMWSVVLSRSTGNTCLLGSGHSAALLIDYHK